MFREAWGRRPGQLKIGKLGIGIVYGFIGSSCEEIENKRFTGHAI